jgi:YggT family protein
MPVFLFQFFNILLEALTWLILIRVLISWVPNLNQDNLIVRLLRQATDPILEPARRLIPPLGGMDISPIVVVLLLQGLQLLLQRLA